MHTSRAQRMSSGPPDAHPYQRPIATLDLSIALMKARTDSFTLYQKIKSSHRYISGRHFHQYRALLQAHAEELFAASHALDERIRHFRGIDTCAIEFGMRVDSSNDDDAEYVTPEDLLVQLRVDNQLLAGSLRCAQAVCQKSGDIVTESLVDVWIDEARRRAAVLTEVTWGD